MELIRIYQGNMVSARELHEFLEVGRDFSTWIKERIKKYKFVEGEDFVLAPQNGGASWGGHNKKDYALTLNMAKELSMVENNEQGRRARKYFIECEKTLLALRQSDRLRYWKDLQGSKSSFRDYLLAAGHPYESYVQVDYEAREVFFNGEPIEDSLLPKILLVARNLAVEMSNELLKKSQEKGMEKITELHKGNHAEVRSFLKDKTKKYPEEIPSEEDIEKLNG